MKTAIVLWASLFCAPVVNAQEWGGPYASTGNSPIIVAPDGQFLGNANSNRYDPNSISNPYGQYGSRYSPNSVNNPYGQYGSPYGQHSPNNPYSTEPPVIIDPNTGNSRLFGRNPK